MNLQRALLDRVLPIVRQANISILEGTWDSPQEDHMVAGRKITLSGWALANDNGTRPHVVVLRDGEPLAATETVLPRPDVLEAFPGCNATPGWTVEIATSASQAGASVEVVAYTASQRKSLGVRQLRSPALFVGGGLDLPRPGQRVAVGRPLQVSGWALFRNEPPESVQVFVGNAPPTTLRCNLPRPDIASAAVDARLAPKSLAAGFDDVVTVPSDGQGRTIDVVVRARSLRGEEWTSDPTPVFVAAPPRLDQDLDQTLLLDTAISPLLGTKRSRGQRALRLCVFTHSLELGGGELYLQELLLRLVTIADVEPLVVSPSDGPLKDELSDAGIPVHITSPYTVDPHHYLGRVSELAAIISLWQADAVLANTLGVFPAVDAALAATKPVFWAIHESFTLPTFTYLGWGERGVNLLVEKRWRRCLQEASCIFESNATLELYKDQIPGLNGVVVRYGVQQKTIEQYRRAHDPQQLRKQMGLRPEQRVALCMGVFGERKAQLALVVAFAEVAELFPDVCLVLVGDHPSQYARSVREAVDGLGLVGRVRLERIHPDTYRWYSVAHILVSASDTESLPRSLLEAMSFGVPALAADVFGLSEVIRDGNNGWLCQARSGASLVAGLRRALGSTHEEYKALSAQCLNDAREFDGSNYASDYAALIGAAVAKCRDEDPSFDDLGAR